MTQKEFVPGRGYSQEDWDAVDSPELTAEEMAQARPFAEVFPDLAAKIRAGAGRPAGEHRKQAISIRLDEDVIEKFKADGPGWQSRMNEALRKASGL